jgi:hypothetical protein
MLKTLIAFLLTLASLQATSLVGSFNNPNLTGVNGTLYMSLSQQAALINGLGPSGNSCGGPAQIIPTTQIVITVSNGSLVGSPSVAGNDCLLPQGTFYLVSLYDSGNNLLFTDRWIITTATQNIGDIISVVISGTTVTLGQQGVVLTNPPAGLNGGTQTVVQPGVSVLQVNNFDVTSSFYIGNPASPAIGCNLGSCDFAVPTAFLQGFTSSGPTYISVLNGNFYGRVYGAQPSCSGVNDGWTGFYKDSIQPSANNLLQVCLGGYLYNIPLTQAP